MLTQIYWCMFKLLLIFATGCATLKDPKFYEEAEDVVEVVVEDEMATIPSEPEQGFVLLEKKF